MSLVVAGVLVLVAAVVASWRWGGSSVAGYAVSGDRHATTFRVGSCLTESGSGGKPLLHAVGCDSSEAVLRVNQVVPEAGGCAHAADFAHYGLVQYDRDAGAYYCLSLVVPEQACLVTGRAVPPHRVGCGSRTSKRVAEIVTGSDPEAACADVPGLARVWYFRTPSSGRFACLVRDGD